MILTDNIVTLKKMYSEIWEKIKELEQANDQSPVKLVMSKSGLPTILINQEDAQEIYLFSKYDPQHEAERFISQYSEKDVEKYEHIFFYGFGFGYHVIEFMKKFPGKNFSIYEPCKEVFIHALSMRNLNDLPLNRLKNLFIEFQPNDLPNHLAHFVDSISKETLIVTIPGYERCFSPQYKRFNQEFVQQLKNRKADLNVCLAYEKLWTINSAVNFPEVIKTPNILLDVDKSHFKDKPALLVSAGPSLEEEIDRLKYIKDMGLAYIFAVGSAAKALVGNGIYPDVVCAYDPTTLTQFTFQEIIELNITDIPFIFGSSVGVETVRTYPGPKVHMIINQDTIAPYYLSHPQERLEMLSDAASIAVVTLELLFKLGCNPIILVGQNLAFKDNKWYAKGIHEDKTESLTQRAKKAALKVEDVYGGTVFTEEGFNRMRFQIELFIRIFSQGRVINTTKGGAKIEGTKFIPLEKVITEFLTKKVVTNWLTEAESAQYSQDYMVEKAKKMEHAQRECLRLFDKVSQILIELEERTDHNLNEKIRLFSKFDKYFKQLIDNSFFQVFIFPMNRVRNDFLVKAVSEMRFEKNMIEKAKKVTNNFGPFIHDCKNDSITINPVFRVIQEVLLNSEGTRRN